MTVLYYKYILLPILYRTTRGGHTLIHITCIYEEKQHFSQTKKFSSSPRSTTPNYVGLVKINGKLLTSSWWKISENLLFSKDKRKQKPLLSFPSFYSKQVKIRKIVYRETIQITT